MVIVVVTVGIPTITGTVICRPEAGSCLIHWEENLSNSDSCYIGVPSRRAGIPDGVSDAGTYMLAGKKSADAKMRLKSS